MQCRSSLVVEFYVALELISSPGKRGPVVQQVLYSDSSSPRVGQGAELQDYSGAKFLAISD